MPRKQRKSERPAVVEDAWTTIVEALKEVAAKPSPDGWAEPAWRDWRNAVQLCLDLWRVHQRVKNDDALVAVRACEDVIAGGLTTYWDIQDAKNMLPRTYVDPPASRALETALAIAQLGISKSDGGGTAFQERLALLFLTFVADDVDIAGTVLHHRMIDALGKDADPKRAYAFKTAWEMGRYKLAYLV